MGTYGAFIDAAAKALPSSKLPGRALAGSRFAQNRRPIARARIYSNNPRQASSIFDFCGFPAAAAANGRGTIPRVPAILTRCLYSPASPGRRG